MNELAEGLAYIIDIILGIIVFAAVIQLFAIKRATLDIQRTLNQLAMLKQKEMGLSNEQVDKVTNAMDPSAPSCSVCGTLCPKGTGGEGWYCPTCKRWQSFTT